MDIVTIGQGKLGLCVSALYADAGHDVTAIDVNEVLIHKLRNGQFSSPEPGLNELLARVPAERLMFSSDFSEVGHAQIITIIVPTPSGPDGYFDNQYIVQAIQSFAPLLKRPYPIVVVCSTVMPGSMNGPIRKAFVDAGIEHIPLVYSPEFIALGEVINGLQRPDLLLIGAEGKEVRQLVEQVLRSVVKKEPEVPICNLLEAEIAKLAINNYLTQKISFANFIGELTAGTGAKVSAVLQAVGSDSRIGHKFLRAGLPYGGPCLGRDNVALRRFAEVRGVEPLLSYATHATNDRRKDALVKKILRTPDPTLLVGVAYKQNTMVLDDAIGMYILQALIRARRNVTVYDPLNTSQIESLYLNVPVLEKFEGLERFNTVILSGSVDVDVADMPKKVTIVDCWETT